MAARQSESRDEVPDAGRSRLDAPSGWTAWLKAALIVAYFTIATVVLPSIVIESGLLATAPSWYADLISESSWSTVRDLIGTGLWFAALVFGMWALRRAQRDGLI